MEVATTVLRNHLSEYIEMAKGEDVFIKKKGRIVAVLCNPQKAQEDRLKSLRGILQGNTMSLEEAREERISKL